MSSNEKVIDRVNASMTTELHNLQCANALGYFASTHLRVYSLILAFNNRLTICGSEVGAVDTAQGDAEEGCEGIDIETACSKTTLIADRISLVKKPPTQPSKRHSE